MTSTALLYIASQCPDVTRIKELELRHENENSALPKMKNDSRTFFVLLKWAREWRPWTNVRLLTMV